MKIAILDRRVRQNIALFKRLIEKEAEKRDRFFHVAKKAFRAYIHRKTGDMQFPEEGKGKFPAEQWQAILIQLKPEKEGAFEVLDAEHKEHFDTDQLDQKAYALLTKTLHILNQLSFDPKRGKNPFWVLRQVAHLDLFLTEEEEGRRNIVHEAWHNLDRLEAEYHLKGMPPGSYLFRKDEFAEDLEEILEEELDAPVTCITLTYSEWAGKISEKTLVYHADAWQIYDDTPELIGQSYPTVEALLASLGDLVRKPLLAA